MPSRILEKQAGPGALGSTTMVTSGPTYTVLLADKTILVDDVRAGQAVRVVLPAASASKNRELKVKKIGDGFSVTIDGGTANIDGSTTQVMSAQYDAAHLLCDGSNWYIL